MKETINNAAAILEECLFNGLIGPEQLYAWFSAEKKLIEGTLNDLIFYIESRKGPYRGPTSY